jgi:chorismate mutase
MPRRMSLRAIRGAITAPNNSRTAILEVTRELLQSIIEANSLRASDVIAATFSVTPDLDQAYPAEAARGIGWTDAALMCVQEMRVEGALSNCIRVRVLWETDQPQAAVTHSYLRGAAILRTDHLDD